VEPGRIKSELIELAGRLGIEIRYSPISPSGLCTVKGKQVLYINSSLDSHKTADMLIREFRQIDIEGIYLLPGLRALLENNNND